MGFMEFFCFSLLVFALFTTVLLISYGVRVWEYCFFFSFFFIFFSFFPYQRNVFFLGA
ncbi:hypothetical protein BZA77DRAFT_158289 [Pyronema omphalodes]|nr:hypothetical protein BZA77DRAFT_158289 [Pyronema omphalodes]